MAVFTSTNRHALYFMVAGQAPLTVESKNTRRKNNRKSNLRFEGNRMHAGD